MGHTFTEMQLNNTQTDISNLNSSIISAVIAAVSSVIGIVIGILLTARVTSELEKKRHNLTMITGLGLILSELEDNKEKIRKGKVTDLAAWKTARQKPWYLLRNKELDLSSKLAKTYFLFEDYNEKREDILRVNPTQIKQFVDDFEEKNKIFEAIEETKDSISKRISKVKKLDY